MSGAHISDGLLTVRTSDDNMTAHIDITPPIGEGKPLSPADAMAILTQHGVIFGVKNEAIEEAIFEANTSHRIQKDVLVAEGQKPVKIVDEHLVILKKFFSKIAESRDLIDENSDHRSRSPFRLVHKGEVIAVKRPAQSGQNGTDVRGNTIATSKKDILYYKNGENTAEEEGHVIATVSGQFLHNKDTFWVSDVLEISGDVDYHTGHIEFPGKVIVKGEIKDGFKLIARDDIICAGTVDATEILSKGSFTSQGGIIGRGKSLVRISGDVKTKFVEHCHLESKSEIKVAGPVLNSRIFTLGEFATNEKGRIISSSICATQGISCHEAGNELEQRVLLEAGVDFVVQRKLDYAEKQLAEMREREKKLNELLRIKPDSKAAIMKEKLIEVKTRIEESRSELNEMLYKLDDVAIIIRGGVHPGTVIKIGAYEYEIKESAKGMKYTLNEAAGRIEEESIK